MNKYLKVTLSDNDFSSLIEQLLDDLSSYLFSGYLKKDIKLIINYSISYLKNNYILHELYNNTRNKTTNFPDISALDSFFDSLILEIINEKELPEWDNNEIGFLCIESEEKEMIGQIFFR